jgi:hypothetical protein
MKDKEGHMASTSKIATLKRKMADYRLQLEMNVAAYVALNPDLTYRQIGARSPRNTAKIAAQSPQARKALNQRAWLP